MQETAFGTAFLRVIFDLEDFKLAVFAPSDEIRLVLDRLAAKHYGEHRAPLRGVVIRACEWDQSVMPCIKLGHFVGTVVSQAL